MSVKAEQLEITSPCPITLDRSAVSARDKAMFCAHCTKDVHLISQMTESEARELMKAQAGRDICVSYSTRGDGSIRFREDPSLVPVTALRSRRSAPARVDAPRRRMSLVASIGASMLLAACTPHGDEDLVGKIEVRAEQTEPERPEQPDLREEIPCDDSEPVEGGLRAEPLPEPDPIPPEQMVDGGLRAEPLPEDPPPIAEPEVVKIRPSKDMPKRGGLRAHPIERDPLPGI